MDAVLGVLGGPRLHFVVLETMAGFIGELLDKLCDSGPANGICGCDSKHGGVGSAERAVWSDACGGVPVDKASNLFASLPMLCW